jgi:hypothetical protein
MSTNGNDTINHPKHYNSHPSGIEAIELCELLSFTAGNALKYILRCEHKGHLLEDLQKAIWYLDRFNNNESGVYASGTPGHEEFISLANRMNKHERRGTLISDVLTELTGGWHVGRLRSRVARAIAELSERATGEEQ